MSELSPDIPAATAGNSFTGSTLFADFIDHEP
jgi:hypothetical protein